VRRNVVEKDVARGDGCFGDEAAEKGMMMIWRIPEKYGVKLC
jgi:hypothetical protein